MAVRTFENLPMFRVFGPPPGGGTPLRGAWRAIGPFGVQNRDILNYTILSIGLLGGPGAPRPKYLLLGTPPLGGVISKWHFVWL